MSRSQPFPIDFSDLDKGKGYSEHSRLLYLALAFLSLFILYKYLYSDNMQGKTQKILIGIDEAGRGAVIGPLVIAGVAIFEEDVEKLKAIKVKDSKMLSPRQRESLEKKIEEIAKEIFIVKVAACRIDTYRAEGINLNRLEAIKFAEIMDFLKGDVAYVDSPDVDTERLKNLLKKLTKHNMEIVAENFADKKYPVVSAASIMAKVERDREIANLKKEYGDIGPGYPANEITMGWLRNWMKTHEDFPPIVRKSWETIKDLQKDSQQSRLTGWFKGLLQKEEECKVKESGESKK